MKNFTDITVLLDRSGSMIDIKLAMEQGFNEFVKGHQATETTRLTLVEFDGLWLANNRPLQLNTVYNATPIREVGKLNLQPRGNTPLIDAICASIDETGRRLAAMPERDRPEGVLFVIITDGAENASTLFKRADARQRIKRQTEHYSWQFIFMGSNQDALDEAQSYGIDLNKSITFSNTTTDKAWTMLLSNTMNYAGTVSAGVTSAASAGALDYSTLQRTQAADGDETFAKTQANKAAAKP